MTESTALAPSQIDATPARSARAKMCDATVAEYAQVWRDGGTFPDIVVFYSKEDFFQLGDGAHRLAGAIAAGMGTISVDLRQGTARDALLFAAAANAHHGLRRTYADKRAAVALLLNAPECSGWSNRQIAAASNTSHPFVATVKAELFPETTGSASTSTASPSSAAAGGNASTDLMAGAGASTLPATEHGAKKDQQEPGAVETLPARSPDATDADDEAETLPGDNPSEEDLLADMEQELRQAEHKLAELERTLQATDQGAELLKLRQLLDQADRARDEAMQASSRAAIRNKVLLHKLQQIGRLVGEPDIDKMVAAVKAKVAGVAA